MAYLNLQLRLGCDPPVGNKIGYRGLGFFAIDQLRGIGDRGLGSEGGNSWRAGRSRELGFLDTGIGGFEGGVVGVLRLGLEFSGNLKFSDGI
jgi:hypothetical protein